MISKLVLKNFRCFHDISLDGIRPVTLFAGANSVGKSTLLEGLFLFYDRYTSSVFLKLNNFRGIPRIDFSPVMVWEQLFFNRDTSKNITITVQNERGLQTAVISKDSSFSFSSISDNSMPRNGQAVIRHDYYPLKLEYNDSANNDDAHFYISESGIVFQSKKRVTTEVPCVHYYSSRVSITTAEAADMLGKVVIAGNKPRCIEILRMLDEQIEDLFVVLHGAIPVIYVERGSARKEPVSSLGDGINKLLHIALLMLANPKSVVLVDELENGFHYSFFPKLWEIIGRITTETGCQVLATTHSYECINGAVALAEDTTTPELFRFIRIDSNDGKRTPHVFDNDSFEYAVKSEWEVR